MKPGVAPRDVSVFNTGQTKMNAIVDVSEIFTRRHQIVPELTITGSSSEIGLESALLLARNGYITYVFATTTIPLVS